MKIVPPFELVPPDPPITTLKLTQDFAVFWHLFPKKKAKLDAQKAYMAARTIASADDILSGLRWQLTSDDWRRENGMYIPYPATWLRAGRWMDEPDPDPFAWVCPHTPPCDGRNACDVLKRLGR